MDVFLHTGGLLRVTHLLLTCLCVFEAAADCPKPQGGDTTVLTNEALLINDFPVGTTVTLECANGYVREGGSGIINCVNGDWTKADLTCKKKDCGIPKPQPHMKFDYSAGTLFGDLIKVDCEEGYELTGTSYKQCLNMGWVGRSKCDIITCMKPAEVPNGRSSWISEDDPEYGAIIEYVCNDGYILIGKDRITCKETGLYDFQPPECKGVTTEAKITTKIVTPTPTSTPTSTPTPTPTPTPTSTPTQEASSSTESTRNREPTFTASTVLPSAQGDRDIMALEDNDKATAWVTPATPPPFQEKQNETVGANKYVGLKVALGIGVVGVLIVLCIVVFSIYRFHLRKKGSRNGTVPIW